MAKRDTKKNRVVDASEIVPTLSPVLYRPSILGDDSGEFRCSEVFVAPLDMVNHYDGEIVRNVGIYQLVEIVDLKIR